MATTPNPATSGFDVKALFEDPNFIQMLGGIGAQMDPQGSGGILGRAAIGYSRNKANQQLAAKMLAGKETERQELRDMNKALLERMGPLTPAGTEGVNGAKETKTGALELDVDTGDPYKLAADLGGFTAEGQPGVNSVSRSKTGSFIFNVDAPPLTMADQSISNQLDDFSPDNLYKTRSNNQRLSFTPVNQQERIAEIGDLAGDNMPSDLRNSMKMPTVPTVQRIAEQGQQMAQTQTEVGDLTNTLPRRLVRRG